MELRPRRVGIIVNRVAKRLTHDGPVLSAIKAAAATTTGTVIYETRSVEELDAVAVALKAHRPDCVVLAGGDGSYMAGTTALSRVFGGALPPIGFAPGGTVSTVARNWGFGGDRAAYAERLVTAAIRGEVVLTRRPTLRVQDESGGDRVGFIFGAGLVAAFFDAYYDGGADGYAGAARIVARVFAGSFTGGELARRILSPASCILTLDGRRQSPGAWSLIAASVVKNLGLHMMLLHRAAEDEGAFHAVASALPAHRLGPQLPRVLMGRPLTGHGHVDTLTRELSIAYPSPSTYVLDGDRIRANRVTVTPGPVLSFAAAPPR